MIIGNKQSKLMSKKLDHKTASPLEFSKAPEWKDIWRWMKRNVDMNEKKCGDEWKEIRKWMKINLEMNEKTSWGWAGLAWFGLYVLKQKIDPVRNSPAWRQATRDANHTP